MAGTVLLVEDEPSVGELVRGYLGARRLPRDLGALGRGGAWPSSIAIRCGS